MSSMQRLIGGPDNAVTADATAPVPIPPAPAEEAPVPIPPAPVEGGPSPIPPAPAAPGEPGQADPEAVVSSTGVVGQGTAPSGQPGSSVSAMPGATAVESEGVVSALGPQNVAIPQVLYRHDALGLELRLPASWIEVPPAGQVTVEKLAPMAQVWFHDRDMVAAGTAALEPPRLIINLYANPGGLAPAAWLTTNGLIGSHDEVKTLTVAGQTTVQVCSQQLLAPACSLYIARQDRMYRFVFPTVPDEALLAGLRFVP
ncbi:MAG: hypothetical protein RMN24_13820 [Anaerolineae bacterium]|nr:hypothetical protein [Caldilineales bacterium]MDW8270235.1 hypothetical protein [Anaerolineae bacterium]